jgi:hypothetical protein
MRPAVRNFVVTGLVLLLGTPLIGTLLAFLQTPNSSSGAAKSIGQTITTILVANFACLPFVIIGVILLLVALAMHRSALHRS